MSDETIASSLLRQEGPQQVNYLLENLRGMCAFVEPYGRCDQSRELRNFCTPCYAAAEIERLQARIEVLEGSIDYLRNVIDHPVTQWQPIESAPKESKMVYVAARATRDEPLTAMFAYWNQEHSWWYRLYAHEPTRIYPTHWMPLPPAPKEQE